MKFLVEKCKHWDGSKNLCDQERECCSRKIERLESKGYEGCFNKPYEVNKRRKTVAEMVTFIIGPKID